jgi:CCR4-NOT complex subunit CAF16|eukprot:CAMPEP_0174280010 /NCGR_PEP_ID=MMETSP0809-20121228/289_1 /TAXON_ID=73025 ORGANISM="Eutreptiella gymnastica-like, Strain CCMP1594" /NCGR_SAMPLE_ID=MMETSP0809 /ASSEMBLY_ACC=CAM_ASM_000658 /LENGTH=531 /DNA_ID=CAMNT_0015372669 /DNA_START=37 /DNA_END=1632 /DNA_ORIENTATION=+
MAQHVAIDVQNAKYDYEYKDGSRTPALRDCTLQIRHGDRVVLMGANGSGKSTLLGAIAGMHKVIDGKVTVLGSDAFTDTNLQQRVARIGQAWPDNANWCETVRQTAATYPRLDWDRFESLCKLLHVNPDWRVDHCSCGMKRKIQVLLGLIYPKEILCLDEFSADLDVVEREHILNYLKEESETKRVTVLYATHIFDNLGDWPTHLLRMSKGRVLEMITLADHKKSMQATAYDWIMADSPSQVCNEAKFKYPAAPLQGPVAVETTKLTCKVGKANQGKFSTAKQVLKDMSLQIPKGGRCMLVGTNGSGKSTLMRVLAGKHFVPQGMATVHQRDAYHDTKLSDCVGHSLDWWQETEWDLSVADVVDNVVLDERAQELVRILAVDMAWRMNRVSSGQRKRIQLLINLLHYKSVLILDEVTADLDVVQREEFLKFLYNESTLRGATIVYTTHIFEGMDGWPTQMVFLNAETNNIEAVHYFKEGDNVLQVVEKELFGLKTAEWQKMGIQGYKYTRLGKRLAEQEGIIEGGGDAMVR